MCVLLRVWGRMICSWMKACRVIQFVGRRVGFGEGNGERKGEYLRDLKSFNDFILVRCRT